MQVVIQPTTNFKSYPVNTITMPYTTDMRPETDDFRQCLKTLLEIAKDNHCSSIVINAKKLHGLLADYQKVHCMPACCDAMIERKMDSDRILEGPPSEHGPSLTIRYYL